MGDVVNLRQARKARERKAAEQAAAEARALHGRTGAQRALEKAEAERLARTVEGSKLEPPASD
jgi:tRNA-dihydrouridine synthase